MTSFEPPDSSGEELVVGVSVKVDLRGGLATVATTRTFRNPEGRLIEALLTFPAPPSARVFQMEAEFDGRTVRARARVREDAEDAYELAATHGPLTIRLEEMQPGLLVLLLAEMQPDAEIAVTTVWAVALELDGGIGRLRIPMTIAEVSGKLGDPGLVEVFEPRAEASPGEAPVVIESGSGPVRIGSEVVIPAPGGGTFTGVVPDNAPLDLVVEGVRHGNLTGRAADGRTVSLGIAPATENGPMDADAAVVVDASTSMDASCGDGSRLSKWEAAKDALRTVFGGLGKGDSVEFWAFADRLASRPAPTPDGLGELGEFGNGKEIAAALRDVSKRTGRADILLVTDGRRHVRAAKLAGLGRRLFVVLVGEDSFAGGGLADLAFRSGGDVLVAGGADVAAALRGALAGLRAPRDARRIRAVGVAGRQRPRAATAVRGGAAITAEWSDQAQQPTGKTSAVAAVALGVALDDPALHDPGRAALTPDDCERLALEEGVLSRRTDLVLVAEREADDDGTGDDAGHGDDEGPVLPQLRAALPRPFAVPAPAPAAISPSRKVEEVAEEPARHSRGVPPSRLGAAWKGGLLAVLAAAAGNALLLYGVGPSFYPRVLLACGVLAVVLAAANFGSAFLGGVLARSCRGFTSWRKAAGVAAAFALGGALLVSNILLPPQLLRFDWNSRLALHFISEGIPGPDFPAPGMEEGVVESPPDMVESPVNMDALAQNRPLPDALVSPEEMPRPTESEEPPSEFTGLVETAPEVVGLGEMPPEVADMPVSRESRMQNMIFFEGAAYEVPDRSSSSAVGRFWALSPLGLLLAGFAFWRGYRPRGDRRLDGR